MNVKLKVLILVMALTIFVNNLEHIFTIRNNRTLGSLTDIMYKFRTRQKRNEFRIWWW